MADKKPTPEEKAKLYTLYGWARTAARQGLGHQEINAEINKIAGRLKVHGIAGLERALGIHAGEQAKAQELADKGRGEKLAESVMNVGDAMTFGYGGELAGGVAGAAAMLPGGQTPHEAYSETQAGADALIQGAKETSPVAAGVGRAAGMAAPTLLTAAAGGGPAAARASLPLRGKLARGVGTGIAGAAGGAAEGFSDPNQEGGRIEGAVQGMKWGGGVGLGLGLGIPLVGAAAGAIGSKVGSATKPVRKRAHGLLANILEDSDVPPGTLPEVMGDLPAGSAIGDIKGALRRKARAVRNMSPDLEDTPEMASIQGRATATGERMGDDLRAAAGLEGGYQPKQVFAASRKVWKKNQLTPILEETPFVRTDGLQEMAEHNAELTRALKKKGIKVGEIGEEIDTDLLWATREQLLARAKNPKLDNHQRGQVYDAISELTPYMDERIAGFGDMLAQYKHINAVESAFEIGEAAGTSSVRVLEETMDGLDLDNPEISEAFKQGLAAWFEKGLEDTAAGGAVASKLRALTPRMQAKLKAVFGGKGDELAAYVERDIVNKERRWSLLHNAINNNSTTPQQLNDIEGVMADPTRAPQIRDFINRAYLFINTNPGTRRETLRELGQLMLDDTMSPSQIKLLSDSMVDMMETQGLQARSAVAGMGAQASEFGPGQGPSLFGAAAPAPTQMPQAPPAAQPPSMFPNDTGPRPLPGPAGQIEQQALGALTPFPPPQIFPK